MTPYSKRLLVQTTGFLLLTQNVLVLGNETPMYQSNPANIVRNLMNGDTYAEIYLQYHRCVWSEYGNSADDYDNGCGGDGNGDYWYMGRTPCYRANVAYSLYGVPVGQETPQNPCQRKRYINSFFTTQGVETFAESMGIDDYGDATDQCTIYSGGDGGDANTMDNNARLYSGYSSYTTSCAADGSFVQSLFPGAYCTGSGDVTTLDDLEEFNTAVGNMECVQVYLAVSNDDGQNNGGDGGGDGIYGLLSYSDSCSPMEYPNGCPDPFEAKHSYEFRPKSQQSLWNQMTWMDHVAWVFLLLAALFFLIPCCNFKDEEEEEAPRYWCFRRNKNGEKRGFRQWFRTKILRRRST